MRGQFGDRFPLGKNEDEKTKSNRMKAAVASTGIKQKPYGGKNEPN
jgi:hypothetical protein